MFTPGPLGLSALRVFLESRPDFSNGPRGFFSLLPPLLCYKPLPTTTPPSSVSDGADRGLGWQGTPPPPPPPLFPTHPASLALHLLDLNGTWECCDVMHWCIERTAFLCFFFFPPHPWAVPSILQWYQAVFCFAIAAYSIPFLLIFCSYLSCSPLVRFAYVRCSPQLHKRGAVRAVWQIWCKWEERQSNSFRGRDLQCACAVWLFCVKRPILTAAI